MKWSVQRGICQGGTNENYLRLDSLDVAMLTKHVLMSEGV